MCKVLCEIAYCNTHQYPKRQVLLSPIPQFIARPRAVELSSTPTLSTPPYPTPPHRTPSQVGSPWSSCWPTSPHPLAITDCTTDSESSWVTQILPPGNSELDSKESHQSKLVTWMGGHITSTTPAKKHPLPCAYRSRKIQSGGRERKWHREKQKDSLPVLGPQPLRRLSYWFHWFGLLK